jgi:hypothetical protein
MTFDPICICCNKYVLYNTIIKCSSCGSMSIHDNCYKKHYKRNKRNSNKRNGKQLCLMRWKCSGSIMGPPEPAKVADAAAAAAAAASPEPAKAVYDDDDDDDIEIEMLILLCLGAGSGAAGQTL